MTKKLPKTHITLLLDRSGSMSSFGDEAIAGINNYVANQIAVEGPLHVKVVLFDDMNPHEVVRNVKIDRRAANSGWEPLTYSECQPRGMTPLHDAMNRAIAATQTPDDTQQIFVVLTDGLENASKEVSAEQVKAMVESLTAQGWVFIYLGANQDAVLAASSVGISGGNTQNFAGDGDGIALAYASASAVSSNVRSRSAGGQSFNPAAVYASTDTERSAEADYQRRSSR